MPGGMMGKLATPSDIGPGMDRRRFLQAIGAAGLAAGFAASVSACGGPQSTRDSEGGGGVDKDGTIEAGISYALSTGFDPMIASSAAVLAANLHVFEGLVDLDPVTREPYPALAAKLPEKVDDTTWRVTLREGATWHDGSKVTADDVVFSFTRIIAPDSTSLMKQFLPFLAGVTKIDDKTAEFKLKYPFALFPERVSVTKIVPKAVVEANSQAFDSLPTGSGPYKIVEATKDDKMVFERHDAYNGPRPALAKKMNWRFLTDPAARATAIESARVHAIEDVPYLDVDRLAKTASVESVQSFGLLFMMFNCKQKPFDDKRVRQALFYATDLNKIISTALLGNAAPATSFVQEGHPGYRRAKTVYTYDPAKAKTLLAAAGASNLAVTLVTTDTGWVKDCAPLIKESWDAIGVSTTLDIGQSGGQYKEKIDTGRFQVMVAPGDPSVFGNDVDLLLRWWFVGTWMDTRHRWAGTPEATKVSALLDQAAREADADKQRALWGEAYDLISEEAPLYPLLHRKLPTAWNPKTLKDFKPLPTTGLSFLGVSRTS
ncbi:MULTISPECIES: ABC transporter substrate-binding protein [unclassified Micromonospora]|uniref:ABC transporter substrate-binding protein n=1 Tax=unclassified Micromonospora TaxID=2617518 RepID=UPI003333E50E